MSGLDPLNDAEALAVLERFVVENDALADLDAEIGRLNIFDALGIVNTEIRHSNFLAWLLDPAESHGQGQLFLRAVLLDLLREAPPQDRPMSPVDLDGADLRGVQIRREWRHIDILIAADEPRVVIAIENKILSGEHSNQLKRYKETVQSAFPEHRPLFVFLTREGDEPSEEAWCSYDYGKLFGSLNRCVRRNEDSIGEEVRVFVGHYLALLRSRFMDDPKIDELVDRIYRNHRQALDLIFERKSDPQRALVAAFIDALCGHLPELIVQGGNHRKSYAPASMADVVKGIDPEQKIYRTAQIHGHVRAWPKKFSTWISYRAPDEAEAHARVVSAMKANPGLLSLEKIESPAKIKQAVYTHRILHSNEGLLDSDDAIEKVREGAAHIAERFQQIEAAIRAHTN